MNYIKDLKEGKKIKEIYLCKSKKSGLTKAGASFETLILQDKTGMIEAKIWDLTDNGIAGFSELDYIEVTGDVTTFAGNLQVNVKRVRIPLRKEFDEENYLPVSRYNVDEMYDKLLKCVAAVSEPHLSKLLTFFFFDNKEFVESFKKSSAAKSVHHAFIGGLLEHTLSVARLCECYCRQYAALNRDLLLTAALLHDIGKVKELSAFPQNEYTDDGQLLGHIVIGAQMIMVAVSEIPGFDHKLSNQLIHCVLSHHGELEFGSPKRPALIEAVALNFADNTDAKLEAFTEALEASNEPEWLGYNKWFESQLMRT